MKIKHHMIRKFNDAKKAPLWKWAIVVFIVIAMPLFFAFANMIGTQEAIEIDNQETAEADT